MEVVLQLLQCVLHGATVGIFHLRPAGNTGFYGEAEDIAGNLLFQLVDKKRSFGTRSDKTHIADQYVEHLRRFVKTDLAQHASNPSHTGIVLASPYRTGALFSVDAHRTKFV